jgi:sugar lactone lactonase YvrE
VRRALGLAVGLMVGVAGALLVVWPASARDEVSVFAHVPAPGYPANALLAGKRIYAGTFHSFTMPSDTGPSKVFAFSLAGKLVRTYTISGQTPGAAHGVQVAAVDRAGVLYLLDQAPARIVKLDPRTGHQSTWATFSMVPACPGGKPNGQCTLGPAGNAPEPDFAVWGPDGSLYVTDYNQSLIWRVPAQGGKASVWLTDSRFNGVIVGAAGIVLLPDKKTMLVDTGGGGSDPSTGKLYSFQIQPDGRPGPLKQLWESAPTEAPDGFAVARSGDIYIALVGPAGNAVVELSPQYKEIARVPANAAANQMQPVPFDAPGSITFLGDQVLVANQSALANNSNDMALLEINVGEPGLPLPKAPPLPGYALRVRPSVLLLGHLTRIRFRATFRTKRGRVRPVAGALIRLAGHVVRTDRRGHATITTTFLFVGRYRARLIKAGRKLTVTTVRVVLP